MRCEEFLNLIAEAKAAGSSEMIGSFVTRVSTVRHFRIRNVDGKVNGNPHDLWLESRSGATLLDRIYTVSPKMAQRLGEWPSRIEFMRVTRRMKDGQI